MQAAADPTNSIPVYGADNIASVYSQERANMMNHQIAVETNAMNAAIANAKNNLDYKIFQETNEYNSPVAQVQRFLDAGINPLGAMSSGSIGSGNASAYQTAMPVMQTGNPMQGASFLDSASQFWNGFNSVGNQVKNIADTMLSFGRLENETGLSGSQIAMNDYKMAEAHANTQKTLAETNTLIPLQARKAISEMRDIDSQIEYRKKQGEGIDSEIRLRSANEELWKAEAANMRETVRIAWANYNLGRDRFGLEQEQFGLEQNKFDFEKEKFEKEFPLEEARTFSESHSNPYKSAINLLRRFMSGKVSPDSLLSSQSDAALYNTFMFLSEHPIRIDGSITDSAELTDSIYGELARRYMSVPKNVNTATTPGAVVNPSNSDTYQ